MNFNVYLDSRTAKRLATAARQRRRPRNAIVREAVEQWLVRQGAAWPDAVREFVGDSALEPFEARRRELAEPAEDPFG